MHRHQQEISVGIVKQLTQTCFTNKKMYLSNKLLNQSWIS